MSKSANDLTTIHLHLDGDPFARVRKSALEDATLTWKAKGLLSYLLGKPHDWRVRQADLVNRSNDGKTAVQSGIRELEAAGYVKRENVREAGKFMAIIWHVSDRPIFLPQTGNPSAVKETAGLPQTEKPAMENPPVTKNDSSKNDLTKKKKASKGNGNTGDPRKEEFKKLWAENYQRHFSRAALFCKKDDEHIREMLRDTTLTPKELADFAVNAWYQKGPKFWNCERSRSIDFFAKYFARIINELDDGQPTKPGQDDHESRYGCPRGKIPLSQRPPPGEDEACNRITMDEWEERFPITLYDQDK